MTSLTQALPLTNGIDNQLCFLIIDYLVNVNVWTKQVFSSSQYAYIKDDLASKQRPSIFCYPLRSSKRTFSGSQTGKIRLELHFSFQEQRIKLAQNVIQIVNLLELINLNKDFLIYAQPFMNGLIWVGKDTDADYTKVYDKEAMAYLDLDFKVDLMSYRLSLEAQGMDITSPDEQIYNIVTSMIEQNAILDNNLDPVIII